MGLYTPKSAAQLSAADLESPGTVLSDTPWIIVSGYGNRRIWRSNLVQFNSLLFIQCQITPTVASIRFFYCKVDPTIIHTVYIQHFLYHTVHTCNLLLFLYTVILQNVENEKEVFVYMFLFISIGSDKSSY